MTAEGMLSIVPRGTTYQVRYALSNPYGMDHPPYTCPDEGTWGIDSRWREIKYQ
jgi:hypothetical protein